MHSRGKRTAGAAAVLAGAVLATAIAGAPAAGAAERGSVRPMTTATTTLRLPDGKRTAHVWKTWYRKSNGKYHGHYGFTSASKGVSVYVVLDGNPRALSKGKTYSYSNRSEVWLFACDNAYPNGEDCTTNW